MAFKEHFLKFVPVGLYTMLILSSLFFLVELVISHFTHSLTLLVNSYQMLCNIIAISGSILTIKKLHLVVKEAAEDVNNPADDDHVTGNASLNCLGQVMITDNVTKESASTQSIKHFEKSLKNTFGWARIDILVMLIGCVFLASLCFSVLVEALQTLIHIKDKDEMHNPFIVLTIGCVGFVLNGICLLLIGGYSFHHGSYLYMTPAGDVVLQKAVMTTDSTSYGERRLSSQLPVPSPTQQKRQGPKEMMRDVIGCVFVIVCSIVVYLTTGLSYAKYLDPIISIISSSCLLVLSYPYIKKSCLILLQTIPDHININSLRYQLLQAFPNIVNVHDLHVWQLTADKTISTVHIVFLNPSDYLQRTKEINEFFLEQGITHSTIQAEFVPEIISPQEKNAFINNLNQEDTTKSCLMQCLTEECRKRHCCMRAEETNLKKVKVIETHCTEEQAVCAESSFKKINDEETNIEEEEDVIDIKL